MDGDGSEQHGEIRRTGGAAVWAGVLAVVAVLAVLLVWAGRDGAAPETTTPTTPPPTASTLPRPLPVLHVVADTDAGPRPATTAAAPDPGAAGIPFEVLQAAPIVTDGRVVLLVDGGAVLVGRPGEGFAAIDLGVPSSGVVASNEPGHVWVRAPRDELALVDLDGSDPPVRIPIGGDRVLGPATFGVVTVSDAGAVSWRRPSFDRAPVPIPDDRTVLDAGGRFVLALGPVPPGDGRRFEIWSIVDGSPVTAFSADDADSPAAIAADGSSVALPNGDGWTIHDVETRDPRGSLPPAAGDPVWVGDGRWAVLTDGVATLSDGSTLSPPWRLRALAEQSP